MSTGETHYELPDLLVRAGATLRGRNRADCPRCGKRRTVSYATEVFHCHHTGCNFRGNTITLARELGLLKRLSAKEAQELRVEREQALTVALWTTQCVRERRQELYQFHRDLLGIYHGSVMRLSKNRQDEIGWSCLAYFYKQIPAVRAELNLLEEAPPLERIRYLDANEGKQRGMVCAVIEAGGVEDADGRFIEVEWANNCPAMRSG